MQRIGVFEQASTGRAEKGNEHDASKLTGGIVFLDEIGDLSQALQPKLLPVLSGGAFYRVGGEGDAKHELQFRGTVLTASWRSLDSELLRPDLLSRVAAYSLEVPGLADRMEDFNDLLDGVEASVLTGVMRAIDDADTVEPELDRDFWRGRKAALKGLDRTARCALAQVDWSRHGNLRGLAAAVEQIIASERSHNAVLEELPIVGVEPKVGNRDGLLDHLLQVAGPGEGLAGQVRAVEVRSRAELREQLAADRPLRRQLARQMRLTEQQFSAQLRELSRRRRKSDRGQE
jgi:DNA-binding NtrC family response regulator